MERGSISLIAQVLTSMKDAVGKLDEAYKRKDAEEIAAAKKEILNLQNQIDKLI